MLKHDQSDAAIGGDVIAHGQPADSEQQGRRRRGQAAGKEAVLFARHLAQEQRGILWGLIESSPAGAGDSWDVLPPFSAIPISISRPPTAPCGFPVRRIREAPRSRLGLWAGIGTG